MTDREPTGGRATSQAIGRSRRRVIVGYVIGLLAVVVALGAVAVWQVTERATDQAEQAAADTITRSALAVGLTLTSEDIAAGQGWQERLEAAVAGRVSDGELAAVHVWRKLDEARGEILWSTTDGLAGQTPELGGVAEALATGAAVVHSLDDGTQSQGPAIGHLYEVYLPFTDTTGASYVLEMYKPVIEYDEIRSDMLRTWLPFSILGVVVVAAIMISLSIRMARAAARAERERALFADRALRARAEEHHRISEILHERTVQDLAAVRLMLDTVRGESAPEAIGRVLDQTTELLAHDVADLRNLLTDGEGSEWQADDLRTALEHWVADLPLGDRVTLDLGPTPLLLQDDDVALAFRVIKEALRNAAKHADAANVLVRVERGPTTLIAEVRDDGRGFDQGATPGLGYRIIRYATEQANGAAEVVSAPGAGTVVRIRVPRAT